MSVDVAMTAHKIVLADGERFDAAPEQTILEAARAAGLLMEHSCSTGRCGSCRSRLLQGSVAALKDTLALTPQELHEGWVLTCAHSARSDLLLDNSSLPAGVGSATVVPARIAELSRPNADVLRVILRFPPSARLQCVPGQHLEVRSPHGVWRRYSVANAAAPGAPIELHVRRVAGGRFSDYWFADAGVGDLLRVRGPLGTFCLRPWTGRHLAFLATGTGIAPIVAMLSQLDSAAPGARPAGCSLYWGVRAETDFYLDPATLAAGRENWLRVVPVLSRTGMSWAGARGHVQDVLLAERATLLDTTVYACGSAAMVTDARRLLTTHGLATGQFHSDAFVCSS